jgi:hypothetical protein
MRYAGKTRKRKTLQCANAVPNTIGNEPTEGFSKADLPHEWWALQPNA